MSWKAGDYAWICGSEAYGVSQFQEPLKVKILDIQKEDLHPYKVASEIGQIFYVTEKELQTRKAKAERNAGFIVPQKIKEQSIDLAEKRMEEIMEEERKPSFEEVMKWFYALATMPDEQDVIRMLAEDGIYQRIKDGVKR